MSVQRIPRSCRPRRHPRNMPWWYRCPRAYVGAAHPAKLPAPQGSHYSITAGERSEPAEGAYLHHHRPQGGRTLVVCGYPAPASLEWQLSTGLLPWLAVQSVCPFDPLGAVHIYVWLFVRGFAMLTRGYRVVWPPWGRGSLSGGVGVVCVLSAGDACLMPVRPPWGRTYICVALRSLLSFSALIFGIPT